MKIRSIDTLPLDGGNLCFNFINTVYAWRGENLHEYFGVYGDVVAWCAKVDILTAQKRKALLSFVKLDPVKAGDALRQIKQVREMLYHFFSDISTHAGRQMPAAVIHEFNTALRGALSQLRFYIKNKQVILGWHDSGIDLLEPVQLVMKSAFDVLTIEDHSRIKECSRCGWIFFDHTKNNKRRWCNPVSCGSTEKSKKYYQKKRNEQLNAATQ